MLNYSLLPGHMRDAMQLYIEHGIKPGSFLTAVLENNLVTAFGKADHINRDRLFEYCNFLWNELPSNSWGSPEKVDEWARSVKRAKEEEMRVHDSISSD